MPKRGQNKSRKIAVQDSVQVDLSRNWKETRKQMGKCYLSKKSFTYKIYTGTSKTAHKVFQQRGASRLLGSFPSSKLAVLCTEIMAEDRVRLQLGMCLQLGSCIFN